MIANSLLDLKRGENPSDMTHKYVEFICELHYEDKKLNTTGIFILRVTHKMA